MEAVASVGLLSEPTCMLRRCGDPLEGWNAVPRAGPTNVLVELPHESNAELADLVVGLALGVEVTATLATAHVDCELVSAIVP